nr:MAG TPA: hypothetical protein [Caudoviricetes sp.]
MPIPLAESKSRQMSMILRLSSVTSFFALYAIHPYYEYG